MHPAVLTRTADIGGEQRAPIRWTAQMVRPLADMGVGTQASFLRKSFDLSSIGGSETLHISALGLYRCYINGQRVGNDLLIRLRRAFGQIAARGLKRLPAGHSLDTVLGLSGVHYFLAGHQLKRSQSGGHRA